MTAVPVAVIQESAESCIDSELKQLRTQRQEAYQLLRSLRVTMLGVKTDATEVLGPVRFESSIRSLKSGLQQAQEKLDELENKLRP